MAEPFTDINAIIPNLKASPGWRRLGATGVEWNAESFSRAFEELRQRVRKCQGIPLAIQDFNDIAARGRKVGQEVWDIVEMCGAWTPEIEILVDRVQATLDSNNLSKMFTEDLLLGCECRRR